MYVLDSSVLIELIEDTSVKEVVSRIIHDDALITTSICMHEVLVGASNEKERFILENLFSGIEVLNHDASSARIGARIEQELRRSGTMVNANDILIAAICQSNKSELLTLDKDFSKIKTLRSRIVA